MTSKENLNENLHKPISGIFAKKFMGPHCNALKFNHKIFSPFLQSQVKNFFKTRQIFFSKFPFSKDEF
jgi:hypothetical protein